MKSAALAVLIGCCATACSLIPFVGDDDIAGNPGSVGDLDNPITALEDGSTFDPAWGAEVTLGCGDDDATRVVEAFNPETNERGTAALYLQEVGGRLHLLEVGSPVPADASLAWAIQGIQLGPWPVDIVTDSCS